MTGKQARRQRQAARGRIERVRLSDVRGIDEFTPDDAREAFEWRIHRNVEETGHPFHHKTASGVIVDADPTLERLLTRMTDAAPTVPVIHNWYQTAAGKAYLEQQVAMQEHPERLYVRSSDDAQEGQGFWQQAQAYVRERTAEHSPADAKADAAIATLVKSLTPEQRASDAREAADILRQREQEPNRVFIVAAEGADGVMRTVDDPTIVAGIKELAKKAGRDTVETRIYKGMSEAEAMDVYRLISGLDLSEYGVN